MGELLLDWARNILFFMVFLSVISHLLADRSYEKYIRFFVPVCRADFRRHLFHGEKDTLLSCLLPLYTFLRL